MRSMGFYLKKTSIALIMLLASIILVLFFLTIYFTIKVNLG